MKSQKKLDNLFNKILLWKYSPLIVISLFFIAYLTLSLVKHYHFLSGYDLSIIDQAIWKYSQFKSPISTTLSFFDTPLYYDHVELIYILIAPFYWVVDNVSILLILQVVTICFSGFAVYLLSKKRKLNPFLSLCVLISYLAFYGFQFSVWSDAHSLVFGVGFLAWFIYFLEEKKYKLSALFFFLAITTKEDIALLTLLISIVYFVATRSKWAIIFGAASVFYLLMLFYVFFPNVVSGGYRFAGSESIINEARLEYFFNTEEKQHVFLYSLGWFGFIPLLAPLYLIPFIGDLGHYFVLANETVQRAHGIFLHYRSSTGLLLVWPLIVAVSKYKRLNKWYIGVYLLICAAFFQYYLHLPLSYLTKSWFWTKPAGVDDINKGIEKLPKEASVATQVNISPHLTHRDEVYTLWPDTKDFEQNPPCGQKNCKWFRIGKTPEYILVDTSPSWDERHFLTTNEEFAERLQMMEKADVIKVEFKSGDTTLYKVVGNL